MEVYFVALWSNPSLLDVSIYFHDYDKYDMVTGGPRVELEPPVCDGDGELH